MDAWKESGLSQTAFAAREGVNLGTFKWWAHQLDRGNRRVVERESAEASSPNKATFVPVRVRASVDSRAAKESARGTVAPQPPSSSVEVVFANGRRVRCDLAHVEDPRLAALLTLAEGVPAC